ncbi:hypothetical protein NBRC116594_00570 [Shimia sp. NS0008-38b]|uniref:ExbD/TolR family protein n=1 Tax=Shimia sp. NS0008-38b TaxID=3127653 RepID=UPI0031049BF1
MKMARPQKRDMGESIIPMINVVFLLLIFFLMTAQIAPPEPFEVSPPESLAEAPAEGSQTLHVSAEGEMAYGDARGEDAVLSALKDSMDGDALMLRADRAVPAETIAALLPKLASVGVRHLKLISTSR